MKTLGNILWHFPFFGFVTAIFTYLLGGLLTLTVIAAPIGLGLMEYGKLLFWPFGNAMVSKSELNVEQNAAWKTYSTIITIIYFPFGLFLMLCAVCQVIVLCLSIIGIPAAMVVAKSLTTYLNPVNKKCVHSAVIAELDRRKAQQQIDKHLNKTENHNISQPLNIPQPLQENKIIITETPIIEVPKKIEPEVVVPNLTEKPIEHDISKLSEQTNLLTSIPSVNNTSNFNLGEWFDKNKKSILVAIGGIFGLLLLITAIKFVANVNFGNQLVEQELTSTVVAENDANIESSSNTAISPITNYEENCKTSLNSLLVAEDIRDFSTIQSFLSPNMERYWDIQYPTSEQLQKTYQLSWQKNSESDNVVSNIIKIDENTFDAYLTYSYTRSKSGESNTINSVVRFKFDGEGRIIYINGMK